MYYDSFVGIFEDEPPEDLRVVFTHNPTPHLKQTPPYYSPSQISSHVKLRAIQDNPVNQFNINKLSL